MIESIVWPNMLNQGLITGVRHKKIWTRVTIDDIVILQALGLFSNLLAISCRPSFDALRRLIRIITAFRDPLKGVPHLCPQL